MGSSIEFNDTLVISKGHEGFPATLTYEAHCANPDNSSSFVGQEFKFHKEGRRVYHSPPTRVFLVERIEDKWLHWGHVEIVSQTMEDGRTHGKYRITKIYSPEYQRQATIEESPRGKSFFDEG